MCNEVFGGNEIKVVDKTTEEIIFMSYCSKDNFYKGVLGRYLLNVDHLYGGTVINHVLNGYFLNDKDIGYREPDRYFLEDPTGMEVPIVLYKKNSSDTIEIAIQCREEYFKYIKGVYYDLYKIESEDVCLAIQEAYTDAKIFMLLSRVGRGRESKETIEMIEDYFKDVYKLAGKGEELMSRLQV